ncbi:MAG: glycosyltransferase [Bacteroidetes bacterium]|nr:glycosyltransferase [Bacteroidota bacterium]
MNYYLQNSIGEQHPYIHAPIQPDVHIIVVIPCYNETVLVSALSSLKNCKKPIGNVEVITVVNSSESDLKAVKETNTKMLQKAMNWSNENFLGWLTFYFIDVNNLPGKDAGVGLARKIGMDEAVYRFESIKKDGIIACFDADSICQNNYLVELEKHFENNLKSPACSIHFEHPLQGSEFSEENYRAIEAYELHLRVYKNALKFCGFPFAFHTIGSSMAVKSKAYQKQGGMNKRKAGEDFYFLQKMMTLGNYTELNSTTVYPSPRISNRVPFGTGRAMQNYLSGEQKNYTTYAIQSFLDLKKLVENLETLYLKEIDLPEPVLAYLKTISFNENLQKIRQNSTSVTHFKQLFFNWFNAFKVLKFVHFARDNYYPEVSVFEAASELLSYLKFPLTKSKELILIFRVIDANS